MRYCYYHPDTMQVEAIFDTPNLSRQANWADKGLLQAVVPDGADAVTRDMRVTVVGGVVTAHSVAINPVQEATPRPTELDRLNASLRDGSGTLADLLRREQLILGRRG